MQVTDLGNFYTDGSRNNILDMFREGKNRLLSWFHLHVSAFSALPCNVFCSPISTRQHCSAQQTSCLLQRKGPPRGLLIPVIYELDNLPYPEAKRLFENLSSSFEILSRFINNLSPLSSFSKWPLRTKIITWITAGCYLASIKKHISYFKCTGKCPSTVNICTKISIYFLIVP